MVFMPVKSSISMTTRTSDLDSLRHVNNRIYEQFCSEGRYTLLAEQGYSIETLLEKTIALRPVASFVKFFLQQKSGSTLNIQTEAFPLGNGLILWDHHISQADGKTVCHLQAKTETLKHHHNPVELLPVADGNPPQALIENVPNFSGNCSRISTSYSAIYTDMDPFGNLPLAAWWRIFEEGRHMSSELLGLTLENLVRLDTHFFWVAGTYQCYKPIKAGQQVSIHTWLERIVRIRAYIRQEIRTSDEAELLGASREEHLIVSLEKARPKALPSEMATTMQTYLEYKD
jgi:acyl-CoA thioesterase FadM